MTEMPVSDHGFDASDMRAIGALSARDLEAIDHALLAACKPRWLKLAMVVGEAMRTWRDKYHDLPDIFCSQRVRELVKTGRLESQGNLFFMRFSEVRLSRVWVTEK